MGHTKEPWEAIGSKIIRGKMATTAQWIARTDLVGTRDTENEANASRIVACVNGCEGLNPEAVKGLLEACQDTFTWIAEHFADFDDEINKQLLCLSNEIEFVVAKAEVKALTVNDGATRS